MGGRAEGENRPAGLGSQGWVGGWGGLTIGPPISMGQRVPELGTER